MRAGQYAQSTVGRVGVIEVKPNGKHLLEEFDGRLNVSNAILCAPRAEAGNLGAGAKRQRQILVPRNQPIRVGGFVEVDGAHWKRLGWQVRTNEVEKPGRTSQPGHSGQSEKTAPPRARNRSKRSKQLPLLIGLDNTRDDRKSVLFEFVIHWKMRETPNAPNSATRLAREHAGNWWPCASIAMAGFAA